MASMDKRGFPFPSRSLSLSLLWVLLLGGWAVMLTVPVHSEAQVLGVKVSSVVTTLLIYLVMAHYPPLSRVGWKRRLYMDTPRRRLIAVTYVVIVAALFCLF